MKVLFIDNVDSFAYNVVHLLASAGAPPDVIANDDARLRPEVLDGYDALAVGPGPGSPSEYPEMLAVVRSAIDRRLPIFGVCMGLQAIGEVLGARVIHAPQIMHGKTSQIVHDGSGLFAGLPSPITATRYHSLCVDEASLPASVRVTARSEDGVVQGLELREAPVHAVQFHPESILSEHGRALVRNFLSGVD